MKRYDRRRLEIVDVAARLFAANGYDATGITDLGEAVGLGRGALYHYIKSKEDVLVEIHERAMAPLMAATEIILDLEIKGASKLRLLSRAYLEVQFAWHDHSVVVLSEYRRFTGSQREAYLDLSARFEEHLSTILEEGVADGSLRIDDVRGARMVFLNIHLGTARWIDPAGPLSAADWSEKYCRILFDGISTSGYDKVADATPDPSVVLDKIELA